MDIIAQLEKEQAATVAAQRAVPEFSPGDTVIVNVKVKEGERSRVQAGPAAASTRTSPSARCPTAKAWSASSRSIRR
jgi:Ribosomal protein L19